jgi:hypothetical protein
MSAVLILLALLVLAGIVKEINTGKPKGGTRVTDVSDPEEHAKPSVKERLKNLVPSFSWLSKPMHWMSEHLFGVLWIGAFCWAVVYGFHSCEGSRRESGQLQVLEAEKALNPDNYWWELWRLDPNGWRMSASGITIETSKVDGEIKGTWRSDIQMGQVTARCIPGKDGFWEIIDGRGKYWKKAFNIQSASATEITGTREDEEKNDGSRYTFSLKRTPRMHRK